MSAVAKGNVVRTKAYHTIFSLRPIILLSHGRESERVEFMRLRINLLVGVSCFGGHSHKCSLGDECTIRERVVFHGSAEDMSYAYLAVSIQYCTQ